jgi:hypothetical protein
MVLPGNIAQGFLILLMVSKEAQYFIILIVLPHP